jgi:hypothetical protein
LHKGLAPRQARWTKYEDDERRRFLIGVGENKLFGMRDEGQCGCVRCGKLVMERKRRGSSHFDCAQWTY